MTESSSPYFAKACQFATAIESRFDTEKSVTARPPIALLRVPTFALARFDSPPPNRTLNVIDNLNCGGTQAHAKQS